MPDRAWLRGFVAAGALILSAASCSGSDHGTGPETPEDPPTPPGSPAPGTPGAVSDLGITGTTATELRIRFTEVSDGAGGPARYQVRIANAPAAHWGAMNPAISGSCSGVVMGAAVGQPLACTLAGLGPGSSYDVQVLAYRGSLNDGTAVFGGLSNTARAATEGGAPPPPSIGALRISPRSPYLNAVGAQQQLTVSATDAAGNPTSAPDVTWTSSNTGVATVSGSGLVTARGIGRALIVVSAACCTADTTAVDVGTTVPTDWRFHQPSDFTTTTDHDWNELNGNGWSYAHRGGAYGYIHAVDDAQTGRAAEFVYLQGFPNGNDPGVLNHYSVRNREGIYLAFRVRFSDNWYWQDPGMKFVHIMMGTSNVHLDAIHPNPAWTEQYGTSAGQWILSPTAWSTPFPTAPVAFNNLNQAAARVKRGEWQVVELLMIRNAPGQANGTIRLWVDGVPTAHHSSVSFPSGAFDNIGFAGTYGGGRYSVPHNMYFRLSDTFVSVR